MILSICPNPCIDFTMEVNNLEVGKLNMIDNKIITYSGKALNVSIGVARLGEKSMATGFMYNDNGSMFSHKLDDEGVQNTFIWCNGSARTNYKIVDNKSMMTEINDKGQRVDEQKQLDLINLVKDLSKTANVVAMSGSLPEGVPDDYYYKLCSVIPKNVHTIIDTTGEKLLNALKRNVTLIKPNKSEIQNITGEDCESSQSIKRACEYLFNLGANKILLSLGREGAVFTDKNCYLYCKSANVAVNSTVGAGDAMVAASSIALKYGKSNEELLRMAVSAGTAAVTTAGTNLFYRDKYEEIYDKITVTNLL